MPSESRTLEALEALRAPREAFRSAVATAAEEIRARRLQRAATNDPAEALGRELGSWAVGRIDPARMAGLLRVGEAPDPLTHQLMDTAHDLFAEISTAQGGGFVVDVPPGGDLRDTVRDALSDLGRAFGVSHAVEKARTRRYDPDVDHVLLRPYPFHRWTGGERRLAPPLVVHVQGVDLRAGGLAEFMDGSVRIALVVEGPTTPAPLARLIGHGVFVAQTYQADPLRALAAHAGPGVVAYVEDGSGAIGFVHDPSVGARTWERLTIAGGVEALQTRLDELGRPGRSKVYAADLRHLLDLATAPGETVPETVPAGAQGDDAADRLAAWLLARTDLGGI